MAGCEMNRSDEIGMTRSERLKRALMMFCALILFIVGIWLLIEPERARGSEFHSSIQSPSLGSGELVDNVVANSTFVPASANGAYRM